MSSGLIFNVATINTNVTLLCSNGGGPNNAYQWRKDGGLLDGEILNTLGLSGVDLSTGGNYSCTVSNAAGMDANSAILYIAPFFIDPPETEVRVFNGSNVNVTCISTGFPTPTVRWVNSTGDKVSNGSLLEFKPALVRHEGVYRCVASININNMEFNSTANTILLGKA